MVNTHDIVSILRSEPIWRINFSYGGQPFFTSDYFRLSRAIADGRVRVVIDDSWIDDDETGAIYAHVRSEVRRGEREGEIRSENTLFLRRRFDPARIRSRALLVHEATHAIQDGRGFRRQPLPMSLLDVEAGAYVAQAMYYLACQTAWSEKVRRERSALGQPVDNPRVDRIIDAAHRVAERIFTAPLARQVTEAEQRSLRAAIAAHPVYAGRRRAQVFFDGWEPERESTESGR